jgi:hypothetical protein
MDAEARRPPRVALHVAPRLLEDTLAVVLRDRDLEVVLTPATDVDDGTGAALAGGEQLYDVAVVSDDLPGQVAATATIVIDGDGTVRRLSRGGQDEELPGVVGLDSLVQLVERLLR